MLYRETQSDPSAGGVSKLKQRVLGPSPDDLTPKYQQRNPIVMRIYRDIPVPSWKVVFPNKLLQFRPLDGLRSDLLSLAGVICESLLLGGARGLFVRASPCVGHALRLACMCCLPHSSFCTAVMPKQLLSCMSSAMHAPAKAF